MFCNQCGNKILDGSIFCENCGNKIKETDNDTDKNNSKNKENDDNAGNELGTLWDKFADIYDGTNKERKKYYDSLSSSELWELVDRISTNGFEMFIEEKKDDLNKQPYKTIELLKSNYQLATIAGYWFWLAEALLKDSELIKPKLTNYDIFVEEWRKEAVDNYQANSKKINKEVMVGMYTLQEFNTKKLFEKAESLKDLPNEIIESLKSQMALQLIWGYTAGMVESKYRK